MTSKNALLAVLIACVCAAVIIVHYPALSAQALYIDDYQYVVDNALVKNPSWASASRFLSEVLKPSTVDGYYQPLSMISLMLDSAAGGRPDNLMPFHRTSLALHAANTALIIVLLYMLFGNALVAAAVGLLFGLHPMTVETIPWVGERKTLLAAFFALWSLLFYLRHTHQKNKLDTGYWILDTWLCFFFYLLALMSKPTSTPLPLLMLILDFWPLRRLKWQAVFEKIPFLVLGSIFAVITYISQTRTAGSGSPVEMGIGRVFFTLCHNIIFYLHNIVWPINLNSHYLFPDPLNLSQPMVLAGVIGVCLLIPLLLVSLRWTRAAFTGWLFFFVAILPAMQVVGFSHVIASDKFAYLPSFGLLMLLASFLCFCQSKIQNPKSKIIIYALVLLLASTESLATRRYLANWRTSKSLYAYTRYFYPDSAPLHLGMAVAIESEGKFAEAIDHYRQVVRIEPNLPSAAYNLANALRQQGKYDEAAVCYRRALQLQPNNVDYYNNLGATLAMQGKIGDAADCFYQALRIDPNNTQTHYNLAMLLSEQRKYNESIKHYRIVLKHDPNNMQVYFNIGYALESEGKIDEAIACFRDAIRIAPSSPVPLVELAQLLATHPDPNKQDAKQAVEYARHAAELTKYQDAAVLNNLAAAYAANNQFDKAVIAAQNALDIAFAQHKTDLAEYIAEQLKLYKQAKP